VDFSCLSGVTRVETWQEWLGAVLATQGGAAFASAVSMTFKGRQGRLLAVGFS